MKYLVIIVVLLAIDSTQCRQITKTKRSLHVFDTFTNKTSQVTNYVITKAGQVKNSTINTAKSAISSVFSLYSRGKKSQFGLKDDYLNVVTKKLNKHIDKAQRTAHTIYDVIAPEQDDDLCTDQDPEKDMTPLELITLHGYFAEAHTVVTEDGYILTIHRIPFARNSKTVSNKTVLLHHGLLGCSFDWLIPGPNKSLPYILSEAGYDVWLANVRGNTYSRAHKYKTTDSAEFWNFSIQDVAEYDLPAVIDYILKQKTGNEKINYIGYSMGTTALFAMLSTKTQYNDILRAAYTLAPVAYMKEIRSPFKVLAKYGRSLEVFLNLVGANEFLPRNAVVRYLAKHSCKVEDFHEAICEISMFLFCGHDQTHFDRSLMPLIFGHVPAGASTKTLTHFAQMIRSDGKFQKFDYGEDGNMEQYGTPKPPEYELNKITLPISMISAEDDWLSSVADAKDVFKDLGNPVEHYVVPDKDFNHLDFLFAKDANTLVYDKLMAMMEKPVFETNDIDNDL
ncbi:alpha/beta-hydrolase lipase region domain-containing protein [Phthorimaea operculella]|nr:alpha/beta-hydrolase lipase region domain-containing protein [Phthorimaea operculella]